MVFYYFITLNDYSHEPTGQSLKYALRKHYERMVEDMHSMRNVINYQLCLYFF